MLLRAKHCTALKKIHWLHWHLALGVKVQKFKTVFWNFSTNEADLELVEVPVVVENKPLPLVLAAEVQLVRPFWLVVFRF